MSLDQNPTWKTLQEHYQAVKNLKMKDLFHTNPARADRFSLRDCGLFLDFSKNRINEETMRLLFDLAQSCRVDEMKKAMFGGEKINFTENRAVLHTALRNQSSTPVYTDGTDVMPQVRAVLNQMKIFTSRVLNSEWLGFTGQKMEALVNIGIGGSDLGPFMVTEALKPYQSGLKPYFVSNIDGTHLTEVLKKINIEKTLFIVVSKTFTTLETMTNAYSARRLVIEHFGGNERCVQNHFVAVSTNTRKVEEFGIDATNMFTFWDWVGGRYSCWSAVGLSIALSLGYDNFIDFLKGAHEMDEHFLNRPPQENMPLTLALLGVWYINFFQAPTQAILPYDQYLHRFPAYFQQGDMESNGKAVTREGKPCSYHTGPIIWGEPGTNGQHAFYQLIHQGTRLVPCDFLIPLRSHNPLGRHHEILVANCLAQSEALMRGKSREEVLSEIKASGNSAAHDQGLAEHKVFEGNRPSNTILFEILTPQILGALMALYEHKIFCQGIIWNINSFDQMGVELGKKLAQTISVEFERGEINKDHQHDSSTQNLIRYFLECRKG